MISSSICNITLRVSGALSHGLFCLMALIVLAGMSSVHAENETLDRLMDAYDKEVAANVTPDYQLSMAALKMRYVGALKQALGRATKSGKLDTALPFQKEIEHMDVATEVPSDDQGIPSELLDLRTSFRKEAKKASAARDTKLAPINKRLDRSLQDLETALTKAGKLEEALAVRKQRESVASRATGEGAAAPVDKTQSGGQSKVQTVASLPKPNSDGWIVLFDGRALYGCSTASELLRDGKIRFENGEMLVDNTPLYFDVTAADVELRATVKKLLGLDLALLFRKKPGENFYSAWFDGGNIFGVGRRVDDNWVNFQRSEQGPAYDDFFELHAVIKGKSIQTYVNKKKMFDCTDEALSGVGKVGIVAFRGSALFRKIEVKPLK